ncbi:cadherin-like domain-containing protein, partial [uncultured Enterovirga sp.]|uniref:cadherin-like domain-containing protein n=1 Tax=uncultured Enterovirga sp. TaxID=2026352 RepID=UPI0035CA8376
MRSGPDIITGGFDAAYYLELYPEVLKSGLDPLTHYNTVGWRQGLNPSAFFATNFYLNRNPDVAAAGVNPLEHYLTYGANEGRDPSPFFDTSTYLQLNPDVAAAGVNPVQHYLQYGAFEGRLPNPSGLSFYVGTQAADTIGGNISANFAIGGLGDDVLKGAQGHDTVRFSANFNAYAFSFVGRDIVVTGPEGSDTLSSFERFAFSDGTIDRKDSSLLVDDLFYYAQNRDVWDDGGFDAKVHYNLYGWKEGRNPNAWFDTNWYLQAHPDVAAAGVNPLDHYLQFGAREGRDPSTRFDTDYYLASNPDVAAAGMNPLDHFLEYGLDEGRSAADMPPVASPDAATLEEDAGAISIAVLANDTDPDGGPKGVAAVTQGANGQVVITGGGTGLTYRPDVNFFGTDSFTYTLNGGSTATVSITVNAVDDAPVGVADARTLDEDAAATAIPVLSNDTDVDGGPRAI